MPDRTNCILLVSVMNVKAPTEIHNSFSCFIAKNQNLVDKTRLNIPHVRAVIRKPFYEGAGA
jgi:hypothetical protein